MNFRLATLLFASFCIAASCAFAQTPTFRVERVASGLDLPLFVTSAPGDPDAIYVVEEQTNDFNDGNGSGQISRIDVNTGARTTFLRVQNIFQPIEGGLRSLAFHLDFETNGNFYLGWLTNNNSGVAQLRVDEYTVDGNGTPQLTRTLLDRPNLAGAVHSLNYIGFDPTATGADRDLLYICTGDGGIQANQGGFSDGPQDLSSIRGKVLRVDVSGGDAYPFDPTRNYDFPASNPFVNDGDPNTLGEILHSGLRNPFQASFDRATGDFYIGDVGFDFREEINVAPAGSAGLDFGWPSREGTIQTPVGGVGGPLGNSIDPVFEFIHGTTFFDSQGNSLSPIGSITGGVVYRGPIQELQGQYVFGEALSRDLLTATFDNSIAPAQFNGDNFDNVLIVTDQFNDLIPNGDGQISLPVAFGEDAQGNLYIVDFGSFLFGEPFNSGEVFRIVPEVIVDDPNQDGQIVTILDFGSANDEFATFEDANGDPFPGGQNVPYTETIPGGLASDPAPVAFNGLAPNDQNPFNVVIGADPLLETDGALGTLAETEAAMLNGGATLEWSNVTSWNFDVAGNAGESFFAAVETFAPTTFTITTADPGDVVTVEAIGSFERDALVTFGGTSGNPGVYVEGTSAWTFIGTATGTATGTLATGNVPGAPGTVPEGNVGGFRITITPAGGMMAVKGDADMDGDVDFDDIPAFIAILQAGIFVAEADADCDLDIDFDDIPAFIAILQSQ